LRFALVLLGACDQVFDLNRPPPDGPPAPPVHCSPISMLADDFESGEFLLWPAHAGIVASGGRAVFDPGATYRSLRSEYFYDLRDGALSIDPVITGTLGQNEFVSLALYAATDLYIEWIVHQDSLIARVWDPTASPAGKSDLVRVPYDPVIHASWRIADEDGTIRFEAGPIGGEYQLLASVPSPSWVGYMKVQVAVVRTGGSQFEVALEDVNGGTPTGAPCHVQYLQDDFSASSLGDPWKRSSSSFGTIAVVNEQLIVTPDANKTGAMYLRAGALQDVRGGRISVEIPEMVNSLTDTQYLQLSISTLDGQYVTLIQRMGMLRWTTTNDVQVGITPYLPMKHRWWQIREEEGLIYWETSADGATFELLGSMLSLDGLDRVSVEVLVATLGGSDPGRAVLDNVNHAP